MLASLLEALINVFGEEVEELSGDLSVKGIVEGHLDFVVHFAFVRRYAGDPPL